MANTLGIRREDPERIGEQRCAIAPAQAKRVAEAGARLIVQPALNPGGERKRIFDDAEYVAGGAEVLEDLSEADVIVGLKEVAPRALLSEKTYLCFSHTHKGQLKNRPLLRAMMDAGTTLIDYELICDAVGNRLLTAFTYFAGYAGLVDTLWTLGRRLKLEGVASAFEEIPQSATHPVLSDVRDILRSAGKRIDRDGTPASLPPIIVCVLGRGKTSSGVQ
ncbi:MAG: hypothetical protein R3282_08670 [Rhodothermales bacterium]|nr:hypothetical protein [Rhodothermales bacterium]